MYNILFDKEKTEIISVDEVDMWPGKQNAYDIKIKITHRNGLIPGKLYPVKDEGMDLHFIPKEEYNLAVYMRENFTQEQINKLLPLIEDYGLYQYSDGAMSTIEED